MSADHPTAEPAEHVPLPQDMCRFLQELGFHAPVERSHPLAGGVSSDIWLVAIAGRRLCIKRALPTLRVAAHWAAPVERSGYEYAWFERVREIFPQAVPPLVGRQADGHMFAMAYLEPAAHPLWKTRLLQGQVEPEFAAQVGRIIVAIHAATAGNGSTAEAFATDGAFHAIRLEPYLLATARRHPELAGRLEGLAARTAATRLALVHGDVSPKNILAGPAGPIILDAECAWYGDPAFDLAFCLNHLLLKCLPVPSQTERLARAFHDMCAAYLAGVTWETPAAFERRAAALLPALLLARVDGKSPVEYITREAERNLVRRVAKPLVAAAPARLTIVARRWLHAVGGHKDKGH